MRAELQKALSIVAGTENPVSDIVLVTGGSINHAAKLKVNGSWIFAKWNDKRSYPGMFEKEAAGLNLLRQSGAVIVPGVLGIAENEMHSFLFLKYIEKGTMDFSFFEKLGQSVAALHRISSSGFGLDTDNYIGSLPQVNSAADSWTFFYIQNRLTPLMERAYNKGLIDKEITNLFERLYSKLPSLLIEEKPSLLHGDLWSGNVLSSLPGNQPVLIDPAVYFGHREVDLAMTKMFGGFTGAFYSAYEEEFPLEAGWRERIPLYQLYPLLVHLNLFGRGYLPDILQTLRRFAG